MVGYLLLLRRQIMQRHVAAELTSVGLLLTPPQPALQQHHNNVRTQALSLRLVTRTFSKLLASGLTTMVDAYPSFITDNPLVEPHRLCQCCQKLAEELIRVCPGRGPGDTDLICEHYDTLQDLIDGIQGGCHFCNLICDEIEHFCERRLTRRPCPSWLRSSTSEDLSKNQAYKTKPITRANPQTVDSASVVVDIDVDHSYRSDLRITFRNPSSTPVVSYTRAQLSTSIASDAHYDLIRKWLDACTDKMQHPACVTSGELRRPTRLLDLNHYHTGYDTLGGQDVRLIDGTSSAGQYAALSYCWGVVQQLRLLQVNLRQFRERIAFEELSQVARDAVTVCRKLSIPFLWIDALCIIQGADGDFLTEAPRMQDVYAGSTLTIVAASSKDTTEAFLVYRNPLLWLECMLQSPSKSLVSKRFKVKTTKFCTLPTRRNKPGDYHIDSRAWYSQERFMSPRSIFFGQQGIHWECRQGLACECHTAIEQKHAEIERGLKSKYAILQSMKLQGRRDRSEVQRIWGDLIQAYSYTRLSYPEDVLIAIAGIASIFGAILESKSTYGLWVDFLARELLWKYDSFDTVGYNNANAAAYLPSWSWASTNGRTFGTSVTLRHSSDAADYHSAELISWPSDAGFDVRFLQGPRDTRLCIRGYLSSYTYPRHDEKTYILPNDNTRHGWECSYYTDPGAPETNLFCLLLVCVHSTEDYMDRSKDFWIGEPFMSNPDWKEYPGYSMNGSRRYQNYGLMLTPVSLEERLYRRVGVIEEDYCTVDSSNQPASSWVREKYLVGLWAPLGEEQEVFIV
jgi:hypothetical protein